MPTLPRLVFMATLAAAVASCDGSAPAEPSSSHSLAAGRGGLPGPVGSITVVLDLSPDDPLDLGFTLTGQRRSAVLDDDSDPTLSNTRTYPSLSAGLYTLAMSAALEPPYVLRAIECESPGFSNDVAVDLTGRTVVIDLEAGESATCTFRVEPDTEAPTVTIEQAQGQVDPTRYAEVAFTATFSEPVTGFTKSDVVLSGTPGGAFTVTVSGGPVVYTITVDGLEPGATVVADLPANAAQDAAQNGSEASTSADNSVTRNLRTVHIEQAPNQPDPTAVDSIRFEITFGVSPIPEIGHPDKDIVTNGQMVVFGQEGELYYVIIKPLAPGPVTYSVLAGGFEDEEGNEFLASTSTDNTVTYAP